LPDLAPVDRCVTLTIFAWRRLPARYRRPDYRAIRSCAVTTSGSHGPTRAGGRLPFDCRVGIPQAVCLTASPGRAAPCWRSGQVLSGCWRHIVDAPTSSRRRASPVPSLRQARNGGVCRIASAALRLSFVRAYFVPPGIDPGSCHSCLHPARRARSGRVLYHAAGRRVSP